MMNIAFQVFSNAFDNLRGARDNETCRLPDAGVTQLVECDLAKVDVAGSNPVSRSNLFLWACRWPAADPQAAHCIDFYEQTPPPIRSNRRHGIRPIQNRTGRSPTHRP